MPTLTILTSIVNPGNESSEITMRDSRLRREIEVVSAFEKNLKMEQFWGIFSKLHYYTNAAATKQNLVSFSKFPRIFISSEIAAYFVIRSRSRTFKSSVILKLLYRRENPIAKSLSHTCLESLSKQIVLSVSVCCFRGFIKVLFKTK